MGRKHEAFESHLRLGTCNWGPDSIRHLSIMRPDADQDGKAAAQQDARAMSNRAFIALGSNLGDRIAVIENACKLMESKGDINIVRTSGLWETEAMYVTNQNNFLNGACEVS